MNFIRLLFAFIAFICGPASAAEKKPLKVFILAGQSNMEGHAKAGTFDYIADDPATAPFLKQMRGAAAACAPAVSPAHLSLSRNLR